MSFTDLEPFGWEVDVILDDIAYRCGNNRDCRLERMRSYVFRINYDLKTLQKSPFIRSGFEQEKYGSQMAQMVKARTALMQEIDRLESNLTLPYDWTGTWYRLVAVIEELVRRRAIEKNRKDKIVATKFLWRGALIKDGELNSRRNEMNRGNDREGYSGGDFVLSPDEIRVADEIERAIRRESTEEPTT